jgi:hypothetical protein
MPDYTKTFLICSGASLEALVCRDADGRVRAGRDPRSASREALIAVHKPKPLLKAMRDKCIDCSGGSPSEAANCSAVGCPLWPYRMGTNPFSNRKGTRQAVEAMQEAKRCLKTSVQQSPNEIVPVETPKDRRGRARSKIVYTIEAGHAAERRRGDAGACDVGCTGE